MRFKKIFLQIMIGCLIAAGILSVVSALTGTFNDIFAKALFTILLVAVHALLSFGFITNKEKSAAPEEFSFFTNTIFIIIVLSFITSLFGLWGVIEGLLVGKLYLTYFVLAFATLHAEVLTKILKEEKYIDSIVYTNFAIMTAVVLMLIFFIFANDSNNLGDFYYRLLAALGITDTTLTMLAIIFHKLYLQKHPSAKDVVFGTSGTTTHPKHHPNILVVILFRLLALQIMSGIAFAIINAFTHR